MLIRKKLLLYQHIILLSCFNSLSSLTPVSSACLPSSRLYMQTMRSTPSWEECKKVCRKGMTYVEITSEGKVPRSQLRRQHLLRLLGENWDSGILREVAFHLYHPRGGVWPRQKQALSLRGAAGWSHPASLFRNATIKMRPAQSSSETQGDAYQTSSNQEALLELLLGLT